MTTGNAITHDEIRGLMDRVATEVEDDPGIEICTRELEILECGELHKWLVALPDHNWSKEDADAALDHLLVSRRANITLPAHMTKEAVYCKVKWG